MKDTDHGIGYGHDEFAATTAPPEEVARLARLVNFGPPDGEAYRYAPPRDDDEGPYRPCAYFASLDYALRRDLTRATTWGQARAIVCMLACQMSQTGWAGQRRATPQEREWAHLIYAGSRASDSLARVPGTCRGCNSDPCRCIA